MNQLLKRSTYKPNFGDPRVRKKVEAVLAWCDDLRLCKNARQIHRDELRKVFGNTNQEGLSRYLRAKLLHQMGSFKPGSHSYSYLLNPEGYHALHAALNTKPPADIDIARKRYSSVISGTEPIQYTDKGDRRYHPIQNIKREIKRKVFDGWWDYDIEACATTLIYQYARKYYVSVKRTEDSFDPFPAVGRLIQEKDSVRKEVASLAGVDIKVAKDLIQALLFLAMVSPHPRSRIFQLLKQDHSVYARFVNDPFIVDFRVQVKAMWRWALLHDNYERGRLHLDGVRPKPKARKESKRRMAIYLSLERKVIDSLFNTLTQRGAQILLMHDGFLSKERHDVWELEEMVAKQTGFTISLKEEQFSIALESDSDGDGSDLVEEWDEMLFEDDENTADAKVKLADQQ